MTGGVGDVGVGETGQLVAVVLVVLATYFCFDMLQYRIKICRFDRRLGRYYFDRRIRTRRRTSGGRFLRGGRRGTRRTFLSQARSKALETSLSSSYDIHRDCWRRYFLFDDVMIHRGRRWRIVRRCLDFRFLRRH